MQEEYELSASRFPPFSELNKFKQANKKNAESEKIKTNYYT